MRSNNLILLKLGGSVITFKNKALTPNMEVIERLAREISEALEAQPFRLIIVHGGGSFGHPIAAEYGIASGFKEPTQMIGFSKTHNAMISLNTLVVEALLNNGLPAFSLAPSSFIVTKSGRIHSLHMDALRHAVELGFIPVLYGDAVLDYDAGFTILSGDQIVSKMAIEFKANRIIVGVDVDGLYTADPKADPNAQMISEISIDDLKSLMGRVGGSRFIDVTGGMMGKILELTVPAAMGIDVIITNALKPNNIYRALKGESVVGTRIVKGWR
ncbi:MAG: isopentenyl phosphate kinase [Candidatus Bathyarchaeota archaeon]|nr:isopentenyl phosphate kinase [Candidatus Bathyarchaeota archaeon]